MSNLLALRGPQFSIDTAVLCDTLASRLNAVVRVARGGDALLTLRQARALRPEITTAKQVHAFGLNCLACALAGGARRVVYSPVGFPRRAEVNWLRAAMNYRRIDVVCPSQTVRRAMVSRGVAMSRTHVVRPGVSLGDFTPQRNEALRATLGYAPDDRVIFAPLEPGHEAGLSLAAWSVSLLNVLDKRHRLLTAASESRAGIVENFCNRLIEPSLLTNVSHIPMQSLFGIADAVLFTPTHDSGVSPVTLAMAMASGRPIVSTTLRSVCELIEDRHTALLVRDASPRLIAQRLEDCFADPQLAWKLTDRARAEVYDHFTRTKMLAELQGVYTDVASAGM